MIVGYFIKALLTKFDLTQNALNKLDKNLALLLQSLKNNEKSVDSVNKDIERIDHEIEMLRKSSNRIDSSLQVIYTKCELCSKGMTNGRISK